MMPYIQKISSCLFLIHILCFCNSTQQHSTPIKQIKDTFNLQYEVINIIPHMQENFTQGLEYYDSSLIESSGLYRKSVLKKFNPISGEILKKMVLPKRFFAEGCTVFDKKIYVLTWKEKKVMLIDPIHFTLIKNITFPLKEGWGLTHNDSFLIASNGTSKLFFLSPKNLNIYHSIEVTHNGQKITELNELEWVDGFIYANKWFSDNIYKIDPITGKVVGILNVENILVQYTGKTKQSEDEVLNGIAYNTTNKTFFITGKNWSFLFEIKLL